MYRNFFFKGPIVRRPISLILTIEVCINLWG